MVLFIFCSRNKVVTSFEILGRLVEKKELTDDKISNMTWQQNQALFKKNLSPVLGTLNTWYSVL